MSLVKDACARVAEPEGVQVALVESVNAPPSALVKSRHIPSVSVALVGIPTQPFARSLASMLQDASGDEQEQPEVSHVFGVCSPSWSVIGGSVFAGHTPLSVSQVRRNPVGGTAWH
jgi:hypothetical protein